MNQRAVMLALMLGSTLAACSGAASGSAAAERSEDELRAVIAKHKRAILDEIDALGPTHPWAGRYWESDGLTGSYVFVAPTAGCLMTDSGCLGLYEANWGPVVQEGDKLRVTFEHAEDVREERMRYAPEYVIQGVGADRSLKRVRADGFELVLGLDGNGTSQSFKSLDAPR